MHNPQQESDFAKIRPNILHRASDIITELGEHLCFIVTHVLKLLFSSIKQFCAFIWRKTETPRKAIARSVFLSLSWVVSPIVKIRRDYLRMRAASMNTSNHHNFLARAKLFGKLMAKIFFGKRGIAVTIFNYALPVVSIVFLLNIVSYATSVNYAVKLTVDGQVYGYITDEREFDEAERILQQRITYLEGNDPITFKPDFTVEMVTPDKVITKYQIADKMLQNLEADIQSCYGLYVGDKFYGALTEVDRIKATLESLLDKYRTDNASEKVNFVSEIRLEPGIYLTQTVVNVDDIIKTFTSSKQVAAYYTVVDGDSQWGIAEKLGMTLDELYALNPEAKDNVVKTGQQIATSRDEPFLAVSVTRQETHEKSIAYTVKEIEDSSIYKGKKVVSQEGANGVEKVVANVSYVNGVEAKREIVSQTTITAPVEKIVKIGTKALPSGQYSTQSAPEGKFIWPVGGSGGYISEHVSWAGGYYGHNGMDIAGIPTGTPIFAGASGKVIFSGYRSNGYGNHVIIQHDNGLVTLYAHAYSVNVRTGAYVTQGQQIATVGNTGRSYGTHLHFEVKSSSGRYYNPANYLSRR